MPRFAAPYALILPLIAVVLSGCGGSQSAAHPNPVSPTSADFTVAAQPTAVTIAAGGTATLTLSVTWTGTPAGSVSISAVYPTGVSAGSSSPIALGPGSSSDTITLAASSSAPPGTGTLALTAVCAGTTLRHTYNVPITISVPPPAPAATLTRTGYILTGGEPDSALYDPVHKLLWVSMPDQGQVLVIDPMQRNVLHRIPVPSAGKMDLSPDGSQIVVGSESLPQLTFIDVASNSVTRVSQLTTALADASFPIEQPFVDASEDPSLNPVISYPRFVNGGDVVFLGLSALFRWSASTNTMAKVSKGNFYAGTALYRTPDGSKVLITTTENELDVFDAAANAVTAQKQTFSSFAASDPVKARFALYDSNGYDIVDPNLNQLGAVAIDTGGGSGAAFAFQFSADGTQLFVARSGPSNGTYALQTVDAVKYQLGSQAPLTAFRLGAEIPVAIDESARIFGIGLGGIVIDDPLNYFPPSATLPWNVAVANSLQPDHGPLASSTSVALDDVFNSSLAGIYFDGVPASFSGTQGGVGTTIGLNTPPIPTPGPVTVHAFQSNGSFSAYPAAYTYGVQAVALEPNAGPASGGITADLLAYGVGDASAISVTVGGVHAKVNSVQVVGGELPYLLPLYDVQIVVPAGTAATSADVSVTASNYTATLSHSFTYEPAITNYPFPGSAIPGSIYFDALRQQAYLLSPTRIDVFSLKSNAFLAPIVPPTKTGTLHLTGLDLSVDGKTMIVANMTDQTIAVLDPDRPSSATLFPFAPNVVTNAPFGPYSVVANSKGTYFISPGDTAWTGGGGTIWEFDPVAGTITKRSIPLTMPLEVSGCRLLRSPDGKTVLIQSPNSIPASFGLWTAQSDTFTYNALPGFSSNAAISPDASLFSSLVDPATGTIYEYVFDSSLNLLTSMTDPDWLHTGWLWGSFFDPSGTLFYIPDNEGLDIYDIHSGQLQRRIGVKESPNTSVINAATSDPTGSTLLLLTNNGLDVISDVPPLAIRSVSPFPNSARAGTVITLKGTNFLAGATVTIAGQNVPTTVTDSHTLSFSLPATVAGNNLTLTNPDGATYTF